MQGQHKSSQAGTALSKTEKSEVVALFHSGKIAEIEARATTITERYPRDVFGWNVLGMVFLQQGKNRRALPPLEKAISLSPNESDIHNNLGVALINLGRLDEAAVSLRKAVELKPDSITALNNLGNALDAAGRLKEAAAVYQKALEIDPDQVKINYNLGNVLKDLGQLDAAAACYRKAVELKPDYAFALTNLGLVHKDAGRPDAAETCARQALLAEPELIEAQNLLATLLLQRNEPMVATACVVRSLQIEERLETKQLFVECAKRLRPSQVTAPLRDLLGRALSEPWARPSALASLGAHALAGDPELGDCLTRAANAWPKRLPASELFGPAGLPGLSANRLLCCLLETAPVCTIALEHFLTSVRRAMLDAVTAESSPQDGDDAGLAFYAALAQQCFINEYVFDLTASEAKKAQSLRDALVAALEAGTPIPWRWPVAVATYVPLASLPKAERLCDKTWPDPVQKVLAQQILEPGQEQRARPTITCLTAIDDTVSVQVRQQYEENPYPRWIKAAPCGVPVGLDSSLRHRFPLAPFHPTDKRDCLDILIAGCGTGQHSLETARRLQGARVLAVDLSLTSLCYAKRKTEELGVTSIEYAQADIMKIGSLRRSFDLIESSGVLHHLADPFAGWNALLSLLRPNGVMRIGLYSKMARRGISLIKQLIAAKGYGTMAETIRKKRQKIIEQHDAATYGNIFLDDFFSLSGCRDLLFHVQEHCLTLLDIKAFLSDNGLQCIGFDIDPQVLDDYKLSFPEDRAATDLTHWHYYELEHPDTFIEMYQFWVQKMR
jgi:Tfp pilus assembly protein PilF/2-polyprenyl-3-methyl-5-hydroxy-6-metoxy-1,4-benzoquinol methylase